MEQRLIDANPIYDKVEANYRMSEGVQHETEREFLNLICDAPTVDAVQVVRCKECVHGLNSKRCGGAIFNDNVIWCTHIGEYFTKDHYCADGERRERK